MKYCFLFSIFLFAVSFAYAQDQLQGVRLPQTVTPKLYDLSLEVHPKQETFRGHAQIHIHIREQIQTIWLHGQDLQVSKVELRSTNSQKSIAGTYKQTLPDGTARIDFPRQLEPQDAVLEIDYTAPFNKKLEGLYKVEEAGKAYAFTQFEAISSRLCFPGFDEPGFKTPFDITLTIAANDVAISNTLPEKESTLPDGRKQIRFGRTARLPTYLVAIAVGPFDVVAGDPIPANEVRKTPVPIRGIAVAGKGKQLQFALRNTAQMVLALERYFGIPYEFGKLDQIAIPDFDYGAMENAGAITYRETLLLLDEENASYSQKRSVLSVMMHELAHQWFGNLVTMAWWNDIWLNEGLTSWVSNRMLDISHPEFKSNVRAVQSGIGIMDRDSTSSIRALSRPADSSQEVKGIADGIIFSKGAAVPLMFDQFLGHEAFQKFIKHYVNKHRFANASSKDFLNVLEESSGRDIAASFSSFLYQPGVPFLQFETVCNAGKTSVHVKQSRFTPVGMETKSDSQWKVPVCLRYQTGTEINTKCSIVNGTEEITLAQGCPSWVMPNANGTGYYRWTLSQKGWSDLRSNAQKHLSVTEQLSVVDSIQASVDSGHLAAKDALKAMEPFASSDVREIAMAPSKLLIFMIQNLASSKNEKEQLRQAAQKLYAPAYAKLGFEKKQNENEATGLFRAEVVSFLAFRARDPEVRKEATKRGRDYIGFGTDGQIHAEAVDPNLVEVALGVASDEEKIEYLNALVDVFKKSNDSILRSRILEATGRVTSPEKVKLVLDLALLPELRTNELLSPAAALFAEEQNRETVWKWMQNHYDPLSKNLSPTDAGGMPLYFYDFCSEEKAAEIKTFFASKISSFPNGERNLQRAVENIKLCAAKKKLLQQNAKT